MKVQCKEGRHLKVATNNAAASRRLCYEVSIRKTRAFKDIALKMAAQEAPLERRPGHGREACGTAFDRDL